jgi:hypothetical protein
LIFYAALPEKEIRMIRGILASLLTATLLFSVACKSKIDDKEAIKAGVIKHLASVQGLNVPNMEVNVTQYSVTGNQATAQVEIRAKNGDSAAGTMNLSYKMEKRGDEWVVLKGAPAGGTLQHPAPGETPTGALPPGHPTTGGSAAGPVHPDFSEIMKGTPAPRQPSAPPPSDPAKP